MLQSVLHELGDEASNPTSIIHRASPGQRSQLKALMRLCKIDLQELERILARYRSLETADPRVRDRLGFSTNRQTEIRGKISTHTEQVKLFLISLHTGALGRIEVRSEMHTKSFEDIKAELDAIHQDVRAGKKDPSLLTGMEGCGSLKKKHVDDNITEVDVELNWDSIAIWLGTLDEYRESRNGPRSTLDVSDTNSGRKAERSASSAAERHPHIASPLIEQKAGLGDFYMRRNINRNKSRVGPVKPAQKNYKPATVEDYDSEDNRTVFQPVSPVAAN